MDKKLQITNYPVSLTDEVKYLRKVRENLRETILNLQRDVDMYKDRDREHEEINDTSEDKEVWRWIGDGYDYTRSMRNSALILITAAQLKELLKNGEIVE